MSSPRGNGSPEGIDWSERLSTLFDRHQYSGTKALLVGLLIVCAVAGIAAKPWVLVLVPVWLGCLFFVKESSAALAEWRAAFVKGFHESGESARQKRDAKLKLSYRQTAFKAARKGLITFVVIAIVVGVCIWIGNGRPDLTKTPITDVFAVAAVSAVFAIVFALSYVLMDLSELAAKRREYPLLAVPYLAVVGMTGGTFAGIASCYVWHWWWHDFPSGEAIWLTFHNWVPIGVIVGGVGYPWARLVGGVGNSIDFLANATMRGKILVVGAFWAALGGLVLDITSNYAFKSYEPDDATTHWALVAIGAGLGLYWLFARGLGPMWGALIGPRKLTEADLVHGLADLADEDEAARAARGGRR